MKKAKSSLGPALATAEAVRTSNFRVLVLSELPWFGTRALAVWSTKRMMFMKLEGGLDT